MGKKTKPRKNPINLVQWSHILLWSDEMQTCANEHTAKAQKLEEVVADESDDPSLS